MRVRASVWSAENRRGGVDGSQTPVEAIHCGLERAPIELAVDLVMGGEIIDMNSRLAILLAVSTSVATA